MTACIFFINSSQMAGKIGFIKEQIKSTYFVDCVTFSPPPRHENGEQYQVINDD
jgi:hypothetical protein